MSLRYQCYLCYFLFSLRFFKIQQVYRGNQTACRITGLNPGSEYVCRVCAVRLCQPTAKLPVINNSTTTFEQEQSKVNAKD